VRVTEARRSDVAEVLSRVCHWAGARADIVAVGLAGSWARGAERMTSDVDLVIVTSRPATYEESREWLADLGDPPIVRTQRWGVLLERRVQLPSGLDVEFGFVPPAWAGTSPIDPGTLRVVRDGLRELYDPHGVLAGLVRAVSD
jgi:uncharacterized protein